MNKEKYLYCPKENEVAIGYYEFKKSKFYSHIYNVNDVEKINNILSNIKKENKRSKTHSICIYN